MCLNDLFNDVPLNLILNCNFVHTFVTKSYKVSRIQGIISLIKRMSTSSKYYLIDKIKHILYTAPCKGI